MCSSLMSNKVCLPVERLPAFFTLIASLASMKCLVYTDLGLPGENFPALWRLVELLTYMKSLMLSEGGLVIERFSTFLPSKGVLI